MTSSPTACPDRSSTCLKLSRSIRSTAPRVSAQPAARQLAAQLVQEAAAVEQPAQRIVVGHVLQLLLGRACARRCPCIWDRRRTAAGRRRRAAARRSGGPSASLPSGRTMRISVRTTVLLARPAAGACPRAACPASSGWAKSAMPARAQQLLARDAQHPAELLVGLDDLAARAPRSKRHDGHADRRVLEGHPEALLGRAARLPPARGARSRRAPRRRSARCSRVERGGPLDRAASRRP